MIGKGGLYGNVIRIAPPMTISDTQVNDAVAIIDESLSVIGEKDGKLSALSVTG